MFCKRIFNVLLDGAAKRPCPEFDIRPLRDENALRGRADLNIDLLLGKACLHIAQEDIHDLRQLGLTECVEYDHIVYTVQKFGAEDLLDLLHDALLRALLIRILCLLTNREADRPRGRAQMVRTRIRGHDDDCIAKIRDEPLPVREPSILKHLQKHMKHIGMCLLHLVKENDGERLLAHSVRELTALLVADVARRCANEACGRVLFHVLGHIEADDRLL